MPVPRNLDRRVLAEAVLGPGLQEFVRASLAELESRMGAEPFAVLKQELEDAWDLLHRDPWLFPDAFDAAFQRWQHELVSTLRAGAIGILARARVDQSHLRDFVDVSRVIIVRAAVRKNVRLPELGCPYTFFRQCLATRPFELLAAFGARNALEKAEAAGLAATERLGVEHLRFLDQIPLATDAESMGNTADLLSRLWASAYAGPMQRVCRMLWLFAMECWSPGGAQREPPRGEGNLFLETRRLLEELACPFPFTTRLNEIRNASSHGGQLRVRLGTVEYLDRRRAVVATFDIDELQRAVSRDVWFAVTADQAVTMAAITWADDVGMFDASLRRLREATPTSKVPDAEPPTVWLPDPVSRPCSGGHDGDARRVDGPISPG
jgi:hypothetical protein